MKRRVKRALVSLTLVASLVLTCVSTNPGAQTAQAAKKATIKLNKTSVKVKHGKKVTLKVTAKNAKIKSKKYSSSDISILFIELRIGITLKSLKFTCFIFILFLSQDCIYDDVRHYSVD